MLAPLLKLLPWNNPPTLEEQEELNELIHDLDMVQEELDQATQNVDRVRQQYRDALTAMNQAADRRVRVGRELCQTKVGSRIWRKWTREHRWGRHYNDDIFPGKQP